MLTVFRDWIAQHQLLIRITTAFSCIAMVASLFAVPWFLARIPEDYLSHQRREATFWPHVHPAVRWPAIVLKNILGVVLLLCGLAMLVLPGQGLLTIAIGLMALDFPGRQHLVRSVVGRPAVLNAINWIRRRANRPPLNHPNSPVRETR